MTTLKKREVPNVWPDMGMVLMSGSMDIRSVPCPFCKAKVGEWCQTRDSHEITIYYDHEARQHVLEGFRAGLVAAHAATARLLGKTLPDLSTKETAS